MLKQLKKIVQRYQDIYGENDKNACPLLNYST